MSITQRQARTQIAELIEKYQVLSKEARTTLSEANIVHQLLDPLFCALCWPVDDPARYRYELHTYGGWLDMTLVFPDDEAGRARKRALLATYDRFAQTTQGWSRR